MQQLVELEEYFTEPFIYLTTKMFIKFIKLTRNRADNVNLIHQCLGSYLTIQMCFQGRRKVLTDLRISLNSS